MFSLFCLICVFTMSKDTWSCTRNSKNNLTKNTLLRWQILISTQETAYYIWIKECIFLQAKKNVKVIQIGAYIWSDVTCISTIVLRVNSGPRQDIATTPKSSDILVWETQMPNDHHTK